MRVTSYRVQVRGFSLDGARTLPLWWEGKMDEGKFIDRIVGSLVSFTYRYF